MSKQVKKNRQGFVVSNKMDKSVVVVVERKVPHKLYGKYIRQRIRYMAHDPENQCQIGDIVLIEECRPLSKRKRWLVRNIIQHAA
ncbi:30S ribosomal protein S17 [Desulfobulbus oligotrophicus]|jgi:small subunit ribosomal protein S17|uniref:Small ribosomal subunit protein uS17 n=1 Tax=Desulfobulbus oligotrophicus TaxID=1909699 RepID=A0A7T6AQR2_9BACT|nr:30S ribosomal protein S17 [Desulfobulbus oligotrophicus]MDY0390371.1 30S ribosomal protein S17 [Desulfobulbus oligotrophicus]QQG65733.1 30S ribosomal protein S17 [Desulfobulbus oligotrophicus]